MPHFHVIAFDADDTLWQTEELYVRVQTDFQQMLAQYHPPEWIEAQLEQAESRNIQHFGYGIKSFALSMIETAVELTEGRITGADVRTIVGWAKGMLASDVELLEYVADTIQTLAGTHTLMLITKGDLRDQERKIAGSGLAAHFQEIEIVSDKTPATYARILKRYKIAPEQFLMVGNSLKSDVLPVLAVGAQAVHVPHPLTWAHEAADPPPAGTRGYYELANLGELPALLQAIEAGEGF